MKMNIVIVALVVALATTMLQGTEAEEYIVGGDSGWTVPAGGAATYAAWASNHTFLVEEDTLVFNFTAGEHDVTIVTKENFDSCNTTDPIYRIQTPGVGIGASVADTFYFTCSFAGHCNKGQKIAITFVEESPSPSPSPSASSQVVTTANLKITMRA